MSEYHNPVMLKECLEGLGIKPNGIYVDVTFGGGGHSLAILEKLENGKLLVFDQDADTVENAKKIAENNRSFTFIEANFKYLKKYLKLYGVAGKVDGIIADLGVSSHQFDQADRGFSTRFSGELDMRMDQENKKDAKSVINEYEEKDLIHILSAYGEIKNARTLATQIVNARSSNKIETTDQLKEIAWNVAPKGKELRYLAQVYQAIRIEVNAELDVLKEFLEQSAEVLKKDGKLVVMSYHSLEDRIVKHYINKGNFQGKDEKDFFGNPIKAFDAVNRKPIIPTDQEIALNSRARSAKLRIGRKR